MGFHNTVRLLFFLLGSPHGAGYENLDQPVPSSNIESATPHSTINKSPIP